MEQSSFSSEDVRRPYFPPAVVMISNGELPYVQKAAAVMETAGVGVEVLVVETEDDATIAARRINEVRSEEGERLHVNRVEGLVIDGDYLMRLHETKTAVIITAADKGRHDTFWGEFERAKAEAEDSQLS